LKLNNSADNTQRGVGFHIDDSGRLEIRARTPSANNSVTLTGAAITLNTDYVACMTWDLVSGTLKASLNGAATVSTPLTADLTIYSSHLYEACGNVIAGTAGDAMIVIRESKYIPRVLTDAEVIARSRP